MRRRVGGSISFNSTSWVSSSSIRRPPNRRRRAGDKPPYPTSAWPPTQEGHRRASASDFNEGARVALPEAKSPWRVRLSDLDTGNILYDTTIVAGRDLKRQALLGSDPHRGLAGWAPASSRTTTRPRTRDVLILFPVGTLGDTLGWFPYAWSSSRTSTSAEARLRDERECSFRSSATFNTRTSRL